MLVVSLISSLPLFCVVAVNSQRWGGPVMPPPAANPPAVPPPDGGWGWAVVFACFISIGFSYAFPKAITVYFKDIQNIFDASYSQIAWISSIMLAVMYAAGKSLVVVFLNLHLILKLRSNLNSHYFLVCWNQNYHHTAGSYLYSVKQLT